MLTSATVIASLAVALNPFNQPETLKLTAKAHGHTAVVVLKSGRFAMRGFKVAWKPIEQETNPKEAQYYPSFFNGKKWVMFNGHDYAISYGELKKKKVVDWLEGQIELKSIDIIVDGKKWPVLLSDYYGYLDPDLSKEQPKCDPFADESDFGGIGCKLNKAGTELRLWISGGDGAGGFQARWILRKNGKHTQLEPIYP